MAASDADNQTSDRNRKTDSHGSEQNAGTSQSIDPNAFEQLRSALKQYWLEQTADIPKPVVTSRHVGNARLLATRQVMLSLLPAAGVVAEIGVDRGKFSAQIIELAQPKKLHLIDNWGSDRYNDEKKSLVEQRLEKQIDAGQVIINRGYSTEMAGHFEDEYFDWVYIDTTHAYQLTKEELHAYAPKVKAGGVIAGHDFIVGNWNGQVRYGVVEAVYELCVEHDWEIIFQTCEVLTNPSFAIRRIVG